MTWELWNGYSENVEKVGFLLEMEGAKERLKLFEADLMVEESFDAAIDGVDGVFHTACPVFTPSSYDQVQVSSQIYRKNYIKYVIKKSFFGTSYYSSSNLSVARFLVFFIYKKSAF